MFSKTGIEQVGHASACPNRPSAPTPAGDRFHTRTNNRRRPWSVAGRLTALYAGSTLALILSSTAYLHWSLVRNLAEQDDFALVERAREVRNLLRDEARRSAELQWEVEAEAQYSETPPNYVRVLGIKGELLVETPGMAEHLPASLFPPPVPDSEEPRQGRDVRSPTGQLFRVVAVAARCPLDPGSHLVHIGVDRTSDEAVTRRSRQQLAIVLALATLLSLLASYQIAHRGMRPVVAMAATAATIRSGTLGGRIHVPGLPAELAALATTFNEMLDRLEESFERLSRFSADIAHELRSPLNNLRGEAEVALSRSRSAEEYKDVLSSSLEEYARLSRVIDSLLFLARAESHEMRLGREPLDLGQQLTAVKEFYEAAAQERGVRIRIEAPEDLSAPLDRILFQRALGNLVSNALAHTPEKGVVTLRAYPSPAGVRVEVADTGCGIVPEHLPRLFERFYRPDQARSRDSGGVGLGLAIVRGIAAAHGGSAEIQSQPGTGTTVSLVFPPITES